MPGSTSYGPWPTSPLTPRDGDLVVVRQSGASTLFAVRQVPNGVQFGATTRDEAVRLARSFAQNQAVDVWFSDGDMLRLLERYRPSEEAV